MQTEHPIPFNDEMVRAILDGNKTMTIRPIKPQPVLWRNGNPRNSNGEAGFTWKPKWCDGPTWPREEFVKKCPYGQPGQVLWVRESVATNGPWNIPEACTLWYPADGGEQPKGYQRRTGRFMPRWACRLFLELTDVRVERVQDITPEECETEGITGETLASPVRGQPYEQYFNGDGLIYNSPVEAFASFWNCIYTKHGHWHRWEDDNEVEHEDWITGDYSWDTNPYVWVLTFKRKGKQ